MADLITQAELGRRLGVTRQYIYKLVKQGKIQKVGDLIDYDTASEAIKSIADPARSSIISTDSEAPEFSGVPAARPKPKSSKKRQPTFAEAKTMKEIFSAKLAKLRYEEEAGLLISRSVIKDSAHICGRTIKEVLLSLPARVMDQLAIETDPRKINAILEVEVRDSLSVLVEELKKV